MIQIKNFRKYLIWSIISLLAFLFLGFHFNNYLINLMHRSSQEARDNNSSRFLFIAKLVDNMEGTTRKDKLRKFLEIHDKGPFSSLSLYSQGGKKIVGNNRHELKWEALASDLPSGEYDFLKIKVDKDFLEQGRDKGPPMFGLPTHRPRRPPEAGNRYLVRMKGEPVEYLLMDFTRPARKFSRSNSPSGFFKWAPLVSFLSLFVSLVFGVIFSLSLVYLSVRKGIVKADQVINELHSGNLKARFDVSRKDGFGDAMRRFNLMADEIESLVSSLRDSEKAKNKLLQELAHDLRTPISSLKSLLETLEGRWQKLDEGTRNEFLTLSLKEVNYFAKLVEELLFLSQMEDSGYSKKSSKFDFNQLLFEQVKDLEVRYRSLDKQVNVECDESVRELNFNGDPQLIKRLFLNTLDNAFSFTSSLTTIKVEVSDDKVELIVEDDGPGFTEEQLKNFGKKKASRYLSNVSDGRMSVGIGSLIMDKICANYQGKLKVSNIVNDSKEIRGAKVSIEFPMKYFS